SLAVIETERGNDRAAMSYVAKSRELVTVLPHFEDVAPDLAQRRYSAVLARLQSTPATVPDSIQAEKQLRLAAVALDQNDDATARSALTAAAQFSAKTPSQGQRARVLLAQSAFDLATRNPDARQTLARLVDSETQRVSEQGPTVDGSASIHLALAAMQAARSGETSLARSALDSTRKQALDHGYYDRAALWRTADCETQFAKDAQKRIDCLTPLVDGREYYQTHVALLLAYQVQSDAAKQQEQTAWLQKHRGQAVAELENEAALIPNLLAVRAAPNDAAKR
ncbi:MAG TPA: hypothetical protein VGC55_14705, partial [Dokdonella sp.]